MIDYTKRSGINVRHAERDRRTARRVARRALGAERARLIREVASALGIDTVAEAR